MKLEWLLAVQAFASISMVGVIWMIQIVHYPLFAQVGQDHFTQYSAEHNRLITYVVAPLMLAELGVVLLLLGPVTPPSLRTAALAGAGLLAVIWLATFCLSVPAHTKLAAGFDAAAHAKLVTTNWIRTAGWSLRGLLSLWMLFRLPSLTD